MSRRSEQTEGMSTRNKIIASISIGLIILAVIGGSAWLRGQWEIYTILGKVDVQDDRMHNIHASQWGPYDPDGTESTVISIGPDNPERRESVELTVSGREYGQPDLYISTTAAYHCDREGTDWSSTPERFVNTFTVPLEDPATNSSQVYIFDLHYFRFSVIIKTAGDLQRWTAPNFAVVHWGECQFPGGWHQAGNLDGEKVVAFVYPKFTIQPWQYRSLNATDYGYDVGTLTGVWAGVMQAQIVDLQAGNLQEDVDGLIVGAQGGAFDHHFDADVDYYEAATKLDLYDEVGGTKLDQHSFTGLGPDSTTPSNVFLSKLYAGILPGSYWAWNGYIIPPLNPEAVYMGQVVNGVVAYEVEVQVAMTHQFYLQSERGTTTTTFTTTGWPDDGDENPWLLALIIIAVIVVVVVVGCVISKLISRKQTVEVRAR